MIGKSFSWSLNESQLLKIDKIEIIMEILILFIILIKYYLLI
jgi:hypothetical protein